MTLLERDRAAVWHPYTQHQGSSLQAITRGAGAYLFGDQGQRYLDLTCSWWVNLHGHSHPDIAKAIYEQALQLEHVIFSGFTHQPAVQLAEQLLQLLPASLTKIFYSDNGSTAIEVALKMAYQYWRNQGQMQRQRFLAFDGGYHGDTFGAMSVGKKSGFFSQFEDLFFSVDTFAYPTTWINDSQAEEKEQHVLTTLETYLQQHHVEIAALIIEPLVQGASGMRMCTTRFLKQLETLVRSYGILIIYDEVMTGFGRTGADFACQKAQTTPDIICLAKGLTGGFLPLAVTACQEKIYQAFLGDSVGQAFMHGHSYTGNPLGCAAGLASLTLLKDVKTRAQIQIIENIHQEMLSQLLESDSIEKPRYCGTVAAFNLKQAIEYGSKINVQLHKNFLKKGLLLRPLANVFYFMPPYCVTEPELRNAYQIVIQELQGVIV